MKEFLVWIGSSTLLLGAVSWLIKEIISHFLSKDIETFKIQLNSASEKAILEHDVVFRSLHTKRADIIAEMYSKMVEAITAASSFLKPMEWVGEPSKEEKYKKAMESIIDFLQYFDKRRIFLSEELCQKIEVIVERIHDPVVEFSFYLHEASSGPELRKEKLDVWRKAWMSVSKTEIPIVRKELETEFRNLLGVKKRPANKEL